MTSPITSGTRPLEPTEKAELDEALVLYSVDDSVAHAQLNRPSALNAINLEVHKGLRDALQRAGEDDNVHVLVLSGKGRAFSAGGDLRAGPEDRAQVHPVQAAVETGLAIWNCRKPVIAAVQGYCLGQGAELAAMCDLTIAADDARIGEVEIRLGASPPLFSSPPAMTIKQLKEYLLSGEQYSAHRAMEVGLVNRVVPRDRLMDEVMVVARRLASLSPTAVQGDKRLINQHYERMGFLDSIHAAAELLMRDRPEAAEG
jgi:enoyl-CoA hydratase/carnithine racemase